jgi:bifunctional non-homologous end joining protein LigD
MSDKQIQIGSRTFEISNLQKVMFPRINFTKGDLIDYYHDIAQVMLPHMQNRPLSMERYPDGTEAEGFYAKEAPDYFPDWIDRASVEVLESGETQPQVVCNQEATLVYLANQACVTPHLWLSRRDRLHYPDKLIFDLDPPSEGFEPVRQAARLLREALDEIELPSFVMTTGSKGLHVVVPLDRSAEFDVVRAFAKDLANMIAHRHPDSFTTETRKVQRKGRLFLDYLRNSYAQTSVAPYALRALPGAPVATSLDWEELENANLHSQSYTVKNIFRRLGQKEDPWKDMWRHACRLEAHRAKLSE